MATTFSLRDKPLHAGQHLQEQLTLELEPYTQSGIEYAVPSGSVPAELDVSEMLSGNHFRLRFSASVHGPCVRCLEDATVHVRVDAHEVHDRQAPKDDDDLRSEFFDEGSDTMDLSAWARASIGLEFPSRVLCSPDCAGLCPVCGANHNHVACNCVVENVDTRWDKLKELAFDEEDPGNPDPDPNDPPGAGRTTSDGGA